LSKLKKYHPSGNLKFNYLSFSQSLKLRDLMEKILSISLKLKFTPNTLGCYGLNSLQEITLACSKNPFHVLVGGKKRIEFVYKK